MIKLKIKRSDVNKSILFVFITIIIVYFVFHTLVGKRGLFALLKLERELIIKQEKLRNMNMEISFLENKVKGLYEKSLNVDLLEEEVKKNLGYIKKDETVIYEKEG